jgi:3-dehydroquinate synthase class II
VRSSDAICCQTNETPIDAIHALDEDEGRLMGQQSRSDIFIHKATLENANVFGFEVDGRIR